MIAKCPFGLTSLATAVLALTLFTPALRGEVKPHYREYTLESSVSAVSGQVHMSVSDATTIHERPAVIQTLQWRMPYFVAGSNEARNDSVQQIVFSFYNDQLFRMAIDYDRERTEGMTDADMVAALSETYGASSKPKPKRSPTFATRIDFASGTPVAQWGDEDYSVVLYSNPIGSGFQVIVTSARLDALAKAADVQAIRLDERDAPAKEIERRKKVADDARASQEKARLANKGAFHP